jgi:hypothetical protein
MMKLLKNPRLAHRRPALRLASRAMAVVIASGVVWGSGSGSTRQAQASYDAAKNTWQALVDKAAQDTALGSNERAARWIALARSAAEGQVEANPSSSE